MGSCMLACGECFALDKPTSSKLDRRMQFADYAEDNVYPINAVNGVVTTIIFAPGEKVTDYASGFSTAWEFASRGNHFFLKPHGKEGTTNVVVVTDRHTYVFDVKLSKRANATYTLKFRYPQEAADKAREEAEAQEVERLLSEKNIPDPDKRLKNAFEQNRSYTFNLGSASGSKRIVPVEAYDNGEFTFLKFQHNTDFPAVYRLVDGEETLLNSHVKGDWLVIHGVYEELLLRAGPAVVGVYNEKFDGGGSAAGTGVTMPGLRRELTQPGV